MTYFNPDSILYEFIKNKTNDEKALNYIEIFRIVDEINLCPFIEIKIDPSYLESKLLELILNYGDDDDIILLLDSTIKEHILSMLERNGVKLNGDVPIYILLDILESYYLLFNTDKTLVDSFLNMIYSRDIEEPTFTFIKLINDYSSVGYGNLVEYIYSVDVEVINTLLKIYEEQEQDNAEKISSTYIRNISLFNIRYNVGGFSNKYLLSELKNKKLFNAPFKEIFPILNNIINSTPEIGQDTYIDLIVLGYLASKEGYEDVNKYEATLNEFSLLSFQDLTYDTLKNLTVMRIKELKK